MDLGLVSSLCILMDALYFQGVDHAVESFNFSGRTVQRSARDFIRSKLERLLSGTISRLQRNVRVRVPWKSLGGVAKGGQGEIDTGAEYKILIL